MKPNLLKHTWKDISSKIENLLLETSDSVVTPLQRHYELQVDFSSIAQALQGAPSDHVERVVFAFRQMHSYFESGLLMENQDQSYSTVAYFHRGHVHVAGDEFHQVKMKLPATRGHQILVTKSDVFMRKLKLGWDPDRRCRAYLVRPTADFAFVLFSPVPDLWMQNEIPKLAHGLGTTFAL